MTAGTCSMNSVSDSELKTKGIHDLKMIKLQSLWNPGVGAYNAPPYPISGAGGVLSTMHS